MTDTLPEIFARYSTALTDLVSAVSTALGDDPNAGLSQDKRVRAWMLETRRYADPGFWQQAGEVHARKLHAEHVAREAAAERERTRRIGQARSDAQQAAAALAAEQPPPSFPRPERV